MEAEHVTLKAVKSKGWELLWTSVRSTINSMYTGISRACGVVVELPFIAIFVLNVFFENVSDLRLGGILAVRTRKDIEYGKMWFATYAFPTYLMWRPVCQDREVYAWYYKVASFSSSITILWILLPSICLFHLSLSIPITTKKFIQTEATLST